MRDCVDDFKTIPIETIEIGMTRSVEKTITLADIQKFAEISTDFNPIHLDRDYARGTIFGRRIAHGLLTASLISATIGEQLPGRGTIYLSQDLRFLAPVFLDDHVVASVTVAEIDREKRRVTLDCACTVGEKTVLKGQAQVLAPSIKDL